MSGAGNKNGSMGPVVDAVGAAPLLPPGAAGEHDELQYLSLTRELIEEGAPRGDRTGTGTLSKCVCVTCVVLCALNCKGRK